MNRTDVVRLLSTRLHACSEQAPLGVMLVRLQRLRELRLIYGYAVCDALADAAHALIVSTLRPDDVVCRVGEFEFAVLLPSLRNVQHASLAGGRLVRAFSMPLPIGTRAVPAAIVAGISVAPQHGTHAEMLLRRAELAFGDALRSSERHATYVDGEERAEIPYEVLQEAILSNRLEVHLQPILDLQRDVIVGAESLARWQDARHGAIAPDLFIPLAEETGLISDLTRWSMNASLRVAELARRSSPQLGMSINLSPRVFGERDIVAQILAALAIWDVPAPSVTLEVTENALMEDPALSVRLLNQLRDAGLEISIDDFGTGYSSLAYLKRFPATELKIDRSFVMGMAEDERSVQLVRSIVDLSHHLRMSVVAEGVEDAATLRMLTDMGCDRAQGYHIRRPQPARTFMDGLQDRWSTALQPPVDDLFAAGLAAAQVGLDTLSNGLSPNALDTR